MCGIAGMSDLNTPPDGEMLTRMSLSLATRGPDDFGVMHNHVVGLVHRRLSIIDLAGGRQPIVNEDETLAIICNGEIYDYQALQTSLTARGHVLKTASDSEVILHLYEDYGPKCVDHLNGMFAFAIAHLDTGELFLARDRFGQKPLFYAAAKNRIAFASGPSALAKVDWVDTTLDTTAIHDYLEFQYIPTPRSIFVGVAKVPPGCYMRWRGGQCEIQRYWQPTLSGGFDGDYGDAIRALDEQLSAAVTRRLVADVPVGLFLSGGLDSSVVSALARRSTHTPIRTFSIGFPDDKYDERRYAKMVAEKLGTDHYFREVSPDDLTRLEQVVTQFEEPFCDASMLPMAILSEFTRSHVTVALTGDGADELFGGYYRYRVMHLLRWIDACPQSLRRIAVHGILRLLPPKTEERTFWGRLRRLLEVSEPGGLARYLAVISRFPDDLRRRVYGPAMADVTSASGLAFLTSHFQTRTRFVDSIMELDLATYLCDDILVKVDRTSMAHGLELRSPFLDRNVAEFAMQLPYAWKQRGQHRKRVLVDAFSHLLPPVVPARSKMGFGVPIARWLRGDWKVPVRDMVLDGATVQCEIFDAPQLEWMLRQHDERRADYSYPLFAVLVLELWLRQQQAA